MKLLSLCFCFLAIMIEPAYAESNQFWAKYFRECSDNWTKACEDNYHKSINDECKANKERAKKFKVKRRYAVCKEVNEGR